MSKTIKRLAAVQSNYIPWRGYFDLIASVDEFVILDELQYTRRDWRNRNIIKSPGGALWLTVPVVTKGKFTQKISETEILGDDWRRQHWRAIESNYKKSLFFEEVSALLQPCIFNEELKYISELNLSLIKNICEFLGIKTVISESKNFELTNEKVSRLVEICVQAKADLYVSGPAAKDYMNEVSFLDRGMQIEWFNYDHYPEYPQLWGDFLGNVSVIDVLFNCGSDSMSVITKNKREV